MHLDRFGRKLNPLMLLFVCLLFAHLGFSQQPVKSEKPSDTNLQAVGAQETNDLIAQMAQNAGAQQGDYAIGSGDLLGIEVFDVPELSREVRVNESGFISLPLIPTRIRVAGLTSFQLQDKIAELLQSNQLVSNPQVTVTIKERRSQPITITGAVKNPIVLQAVRQTSLLEALAQAGGISDDAGSDILITRTEQPAVGGESSASEASAGPTTITINLNDLLDSGDPKFNIPLFGGDVVRVPRGGVVYAVGAVGHPGGFVMQSDRQQMTVIKLVSLSGGLSSTAKPHDAVILRRDPTTGTEKHVPVDVNKILSLKAEDVSLYQSDILFVPDSTGKKALHRTGEIAIAVGVGAALYRLGR